MHPIDFDPHITPGEVADYYDSIRTQPQPSNPPVNQCFN